MYTAGNGGWGVWGSGKVFTCNLQRGVLGCAAWDHYTLDSFRDRFKVFVNECNFERCSVPLKSNIPKIIS